jgi:hypothetical protein
MSAFPDTAPFAAPFATAVLPFGMSAFVFFYESYLYFSSKILASSYLASNSSSEKISSSPALGFIRWKSNSVTFSDTKGMDHVKMSIKLGNK